MDARTAAILSDIRNPLKSEWMLGEIVGINSGESQAGRGQCPVTIAPVLDDYPQRNLALTLYVQRPMDEDAADPRKLGELATKGRTFLSAVDRTFPPAPQKVSKGVYQTQDGVVLTGDAISKAFKAHRIIVFETLEKLATDEEYRGSFIGQRLFFKPQVAKAEEDRQFISRVAGELRDGQDCLMADIVDKDVLDAKVQAALAEIEGEADEPTEA